MAEQYQVDAPVISSSTQEESIVTQFEKVLCSTALLLSGASGAHSAVVSESTQASSSAASDTIRPFRINVPEEALADLRKRVQATRWPDKETVADRSQGTQLAAMEELVRYWGGEYDWRRAE